jgi:hypothetical protein
MAQLKINRGTTFSIGIAYKKNGVAATLVGATVRFTIKNKEYDSDWTDSSALVVKNITSGSSGGEANIVLDPSDTAQLTPGRLYYDLKVKEADGSIYKLDEGTIKLDGSPTNRLT